jgi:hypothetical protein
VLEGLNTADTTHAIIEKYHMWLTPFSLLDAFLSTGSAQDGITLGGKNAVQ